MYDDLDQMSSDVELVAELLTGAAERLLLSDSTAVKARCDGVVEGPKLLTPQFMVYMCILESILDQRRKQLVSETPDERRPNTIKQALLGNREGLTSKTLEQRDT